MKHCYWISSLTMLTACIVGVSTMSELQAQDGIRNDRPFSNPLGASTTFSTAGLVDLSNEFFQDFGTNRRQCGHCHKAAEGWTVSVASVKAVFDRTNGLDPIFRTNDGSNSPFADVSTQAARRSAYSMLLNRGVIRVGIGIPDGREFDLVVVDDPYGFASASELSLFRRPLPSANLTLIPQVMWDGRVTASMPLGSTVNEALAAQSNGATQGHAAAPEPIPQSVRDAIVAFETGLFNAQSVAHDSGSSGAEGARGGAEALVSQAFVNARFDLFDSWAGSDNEVRRAVFRGQEIFNTVGRQNVTVNPVTRSGTCSGCHSTNNSGTNVAGSFFDVDISAGARRQPDQPLYMLRRISCGAVDCGTGGTNPPIGTLLATTDPGRALITGRWADLNKFKVPSLRALGARAPYFHNGSAHSIQEIIDHYMSLPVNPFVFTAAEQADLVTFLSAL